jgi:type VII secretion protein EccE
MGRIAAVQLVVVAVLVALTTRRPPLIAAVAGLGLLILVPLFLRAHGRWYTDVLAARRRLRRRRAVGQVLAPNFEIVADGSDGPTVGVGSDDDGWFVAAEATTGSVPLDKLAALLVDGSVPVSSVQVVTWTVPAPHHLMPAQAAYVASYRQLSVDLFGPVPAPMTGRTWVALRLDAVDAVERTDGTDTTARRVLGVALRRLGRSLTSAGARPEALDPARLTAAVAACVGLDRGTGPAAEEWATWSAGGLTHVAFEVDRWPATLTADTVREVCQVPAAQVVSSIELRRDGAGDPRAARAPHGPAGAVAVRAAVRIGAVPARLGDAVAELTGRAAQAGLRLRRLDGDQAPAGYFCAPTGGSRW